MSNQYVNYLDVGGCHWAPADWLIRFYPDDLPEDWRCAYYANEFKQVFITAEQWQGKANEVLGWQEEVSDDFRFFLEVTEQHLKSPDWANTAEVLSSLCSGAVVRDERLADALRGIVRRVDLLVDGEHLLRPLWSEDQADDEHVELSTQLAVFHSETALNPVQLRELFEYFAESAERSELLVFLDAPYETVQKVRQMCELYGW